MRVSGPGSRADQEYARQEVRSRGGRLQELGAEKNTLLRTQVPLLENVQSEGHGIKNGCMYQSSVEKGSRQSRVLGSRQARPSV
jgi:hypothetical protein